MNNQYSGTKEDVRLTEVDMKALNLGDTVYIRIGEWDDKTPAYIRLSPPPQPSNTTSQ
jgi:hypothetical protein